MDLKGKRYCAGRRDLKGRSIWAEGSGLCRDLKGRRRQRNVELSWGDGSRGDSQDEGSSSCKSSSSPSLEPSPLLPFLGGEGERERKRETDRENEQESERQKANTDAWTEYFH